MKKNIVNLNGLCEEHPFSKRQVYEWTSREVIPHIKIGRLLFFDLDEVSKWLKGNSVEPLKRRSPEAA